MTPQELADRLENIARNTLAPTLERFFKEASLVAEDKAKRNASGTVLKVRTGQLRASISGFVREQSGVVDIGTRAGGRVESGSAEVKYAALHEFGQPSVLTPTKSKYLRIPLPRAKTAAGVDRFPTSIRESGAGLFYVRRAKNGKLYLFNKQDNKPWYRLVRSVKVKHRPFMRPAIEFVARKFPEQAQKAIIKALKDGLRA